MSGDGEAPDALEMSDEEFMNMDQSVFNKATESNPDASKDDSDSNNEDDVEEDKDDTSEGGDTSEGDAEDDEAPSAEEVEKQRQAALTEEERVAEYTSTDVKDKEDKEADKDKPAEGELTDAQFTDVGKQIMQEFKANGTTIKIKSAEDAIQLMQMGANYHKKMASLKPSLKTLKLLENNDLLDPEKLNYLIDISQKKPAAISQLLKDSKIDPMEIDLADEAKYVPEQRSVNDQELALDEVLSSIEGNSTYNQTLSVLGNDWDDTSKNIIAQNPGIIRTINGHMESGIYKQVADAVAYDKSLGKLAGVSDFEAYQQVGTYMHENGKFLNSNSNVNVNATQDNQGNQNNDQSSNQGETAEQMLQRKARKNSASPSRRKKVVEKDTSNYNPLEMSDEDFVKLNKMNL